MQAPVYSKAFTRFRMPWRWDGRPVILQSRAWDNQESLQPTRAAFIAARGELDSVPPVVAFRNHHFNAVTSWAVEMRAGRCRCLCVISAFAALFACHCRRAPSPPARGAQISGKPLSPADMARWDIEILADGTGLPASEGTAAQGAAIFATKCSACHGDSGRGTPRR